MTTSNATKAQKAIAARKKAPAKKPAKAKQSLPGFGELVEVSLADVKKHPKNPRIGNKKKLKESIKELGFVDPIVVQKSTMTVLGGNHRVEVAQSMGYETLPAHVIDCDDKGAYKVMMALNRIPDESTYNEEIQAEILEIIQGFGGEDALAGTGYSSQEAEVIRARAAWQDDEDVIPELGDAAETERIDTEAKTGVFKMPQPKDRQGMIEELGRRSIVLSIPVKDKRFETIQDGLQQAREGFEVRTNEEVLVQFLKEHGWVPKKFRVFDKETTKGE